MAGRYSSMMNQFNNLRKSEAVLKAYKGIGTPSAGKLVGRGGSRTSEQLIRRGKRRVGIAGGMLGINAIIGPNGNRDTRR